MNTHAAGNEISNHLNRQLNDRVKSHRKEELFKVEYKLKPYHEKDRKEKGNRSVKNIQRNH